MLQAGDVWSPEEASYWRDEGDAGSDDALLAQTFAQRHAPRIFGAIALPVGLLLSLWERSAALSTGRYHPKFLALCFALVAGSVPAILLGIGRDRDLKVPWKMAVIGAAVVAGLVASFSAPAWFF